MPSVHLNEAEVVGEAPVVACPSFEHPARVIFSRDLRDDLSVTIVNE